MAEKLIGLPPNSENASQNRGKNYLLVIGIDKYEDSNVPKLQNAVLDTERLTKILTTKYEFELFCALHNEKATKDAIENTIQELERRLTTDDNLIIFFSGHGYRKNANGFIVPFDGQNDRTNRYISFVELNRQINDLSMNHFLFILDCCYAGSALKNLGEKRQLNKPSRRILAASSPEETAQDGFHGRNSPFTAALAEILEQNEGKELPVKTLHVELRELMDSRGIHQVPVEGSWKMESNCDGEFVFLKKDAEIDTWNNLNKSDKNALNAFVSKYPSGDFSEKATAFIQEIEVKDAEKQRIEEARLKAEAEKQAFDRAAKSGTREHLSNFIFDYPFSIYRPEALELLKVAEEKTAWKTAKTGGELSDFLQFQMGKHGKGRYADECQNQIDRFRKPTPQPVVESLKPPIVVETPKVEKPVAVAPVTVEKSKEKLTQVVENQPVEAIVEPLFLQKYKLHLIGGGVLLALILLLLPKGNEKKDPSVSTPSTTILIDNEANDFQKAMTIPEINAYLQRYPNGINRSTATEKLAKLTSALNTHLSNVRSQIKDFPDDAKEALEKARAIDPTNVDVVKFTQQLK